MEYLVRLGGGGREILKREGGTQMAGASELASESSGPALLAAVKMYLDHLESLSLVPLDVVVEHHSAADNCTTKHHKATKS